MIAVADQIPSARCVINIASPAHTQHLANYLVKQNPEIESLGVGDVVIGGRTHTIRRPMIEVLRNWNHPERIAALQLPLLILFSPMDETLSFDHGLEMFRQAGSTVSFVTLDGADHLLVNHPEDIPFVSDLIATWATRYFGETGTGPVVDGQNSLV
jgi:putative redox protein